MKLRRSIFAIPLVPLVLVAGCGSPDTAGFEMSNAALNGMVVDGTRVPVASRPVHVGLGGPDKHACPGQARPVRDSVAVHWSPDAGSPAKANVSDPVYACEVEGAWTGIVFPADGISLGDCGPGDRVRSAREYQGPCRWGWVETANLRPIG